AYLWYTSRPEEGAASDSAEKAEDLEVVEFRKELASLRTIKLDTSFFSDPLYKSLIDPNLLISKPPSVGRANPFLPVGSIAGTSVE
ncbi:MAG: hypothetical protein AAB930_04125, partial [Patescibacteria group bacterium]